MHPDIAIVGAGPSGSWAAYTLARGGARVVLFDPSHPREKPCGGGVTGRAMQIVAEAVATHTFPRVQIRTARFVDTCEPDSPAAGRPAGRAEVALPPDALVVASRKAFDSALLAAARDAGATMVAARVRRIDRLAGGFRIETAEGGRYEAAHLVGADGANSLVRRTLGCAFRRDQLSIATGFFLHGTTSDEIVIELVSDPPGYLWSFPRPDHLAIGICAQADAGVGSAVLRSRAAAWAVRAGLTDSARLEPYAWPIPSLTAADFASLQLSRDRWYLVGDAAGLVDPITREGIYFALRSAELAAQAILGDAARASRDYSDGVQAAIAGDLATAATLKAAFFRPRFTRLMMSGLAESRSIRAVMADLIAGTQPYGRLKWRLARTLEFGLGWRLLRSMRSGTNL